MQRPTVLAQAPCRAGRLRLGCGMGYERGAVVAAAAVATVAGEPLPALRQLQQALMARGWEGDTLRRVEVPDGRHDEASWAALVPPMLEFLYPPRAGH